MRIFPRWEGAHSTSDDHDFFVDSYASRGSAALHLIAPTFWLVSPSAGMENTPRSPFIYQAFLMAQWTSGTTPAL